MITLVSVYELIDPFQPSVAVHIETRHLIFTENQWLVFIGNARLGRNGLNCLFFSWIRILMSSTL